MLPLPRNIGLTDIEQRYRQRYLDLILNEESRNVLRTRTVVIRAIRDFMNNMGAMEVETPILHPIMGGASAKPFVTHHNALDSDFFYVSHRNYFWNVWLSVALLMLFMKSGATFAMKAFQSNITLNTQGSRVIMLYGLLRHYDFGWRPYPVCSLGRPWNDKVQYGDIVIDFGPAWQRKSMVGLVQEETGFDFSNFEDSRSTRQSSRAGL